MDEKQIKEIENLHVLEGVNHTFPIKNEQLKIEVRLLNMMMHRLDNGHEPPIFVLFVNFLCSDLG